MSDNEMLIQIWQTLNNFQTQTINAINDIKEQVKENKIEIQKSREIEEAHWQENLRRWKENDKRWEQNERRWEENERRWEENERRWEENERRWEENQRLWKQYEINRKKDRADIIDIFTRYEISIARTLGDPNAEKMAQLA